MFRWKLHGVMVRSACSHFRLMCSGKVDVIYMSLLHYWSQRLEIRIINVSGSICSWTYLHSSIIIIHCVMYWCFLWIVFFFNGEEAPLRVLFVFIMVKLVLLLVSQIYYKAHECFYSGAGSGCLNYNHFLLIFPLMSSVFWNMITWFLSKKIKNPNKKSQILKIFPGYYN